MTATRAYPPVPGEALQILRCQQTLQPLELVNGDLYSLTANLTFPVHNGLVFMGYDVRQHVFMRRVIEEEREHQTSAQFFDRDLAFLKNSSQAVVDMINLVRRDHPMLPGMRALEVGAGSGWVSWFFAQAGYDTWVCELEPNSLWISWLYEHPNLGAGKRIVSDATLVPFADDSFDVVICKEFAHHVKDKDRLFAEANRVLKPGGLLLGFEPARSLWSTLHYWRHPDPHTDHVIVWRMQYERAIRRNGFKLQTAAPYHYRSDGRLAALAKWRQRCIQGVRDGRPVGSPVDRLAQYVFGSFLMLVAEKVRPAPIHERPSIQVVDPYTLRVGDEDREIFRPFVDVLESAASTLAQRNNGEVVAAV